MSIEYSAMTHRKHATAAFWITVALVVLSQVSP
jgi:hypothetical protein